MPNYSSIWDVTPETAHPRARGLLAGTNVWNYGDEDSPLGNDTGADAFASYLQFRTRHPIERVQEFISEELLSLDVADADWGVLDETKLTEALAADNGYSVLTRDDFIVGTAFAQLVVDGEIDPVVRERAITALRRQSTDAVISFRGCDGKSARKQQLNALTHILSNIEM